MSDTIKKQIALGVEDFKEIIDKDGYFVDKTLMIQKLIENQAMVTLFTRPRRFGKTMAMSMLASFFDIRKKARIFLPDFKSNLVQIDERMYAKEFEDAYEEVLCYGIAFYKKRCLVKSK